MTEHCTVATIVADTPHPERLLETVFILTDHGRFGRGVAAESVSATLKKIIL